MLISSYGLGAVGTGTIIFGITDIMLDIGIIIIGFIILMVGFILTDGGAITAIIGSDLMEIIMEHTTMAEVTAEDIADMEDVDELFDDVPLNEGDQVPLYNGLYYHQYWSDGDYGVHDTTVESGMFSNCDLLIRHKEDDNKYAILVYFESDNSLIFKPSSKIKNLNIEVNDKLVGTYKQNCFNPLFLSDLIDCDNDGNIVGHDKSIQMIERFKKLLAFT